MAAWVKYNNGIDTLLKTGNVATDAFKCALCLTVNVADTSFVAGTTDLVTGGGYTQGGNACTTTSATTTTGVLKLILASPATWTASGAGFTFRYAVIYDSTTGVSIGYYDYGSNVVMNGTNGDTFTVTLDGTNGVAQFS